MDDKKDTTVKSVLVEREDDNCEPTVKRGRGRPKGHTIIVKPKVSVYGLYVFTWNICWYLSFLL